MAFTTAETDQEGLEINVTLTLTDITEITTDVMIFLAITGNVLCFLFLVSRSPFYHEIPK